jgi:hypothetical protein
LAVVHIGCYRITHLATGKRISGDFDTPDAALALMAQVLPMADWTQDAPKVPKKAARLLGRKDSP